MQKINKRYFEFKTMTIHTNTNSKSSVQSINPEKDVGPINMAYFFNFMYQLPEAMN